MKPPSIIPICTDLMSGPAPKCKFVKPGIHTREARVYPFPSIGIIGESMRVLSQYPKVCGVHIVFDSQIAVPAHRRIETCKSVTIIKGKLTLLIYNPGYGWNIYHMSESPTGVEEDFIIVPKGAWHAILVGPTPSTLLVTWKEYGPEDPKPAEWELDADILISGFSGALSAV